MKRILLLLASAAALHAQPALTIYNQNFAVVRERVPLDLKAGENAVNFVGATAQLEADSRAELSRGCHVPVGAARAE
jgi:hypothetical protein